ncbi:transposase family protein [Streptomyces olivochromogenes]|uniref:transposase family protein n=1 Tax=Streptomyces olivochromogenes TaxID=1963 RepID=UPI000B075B19|nr:transposase family protein [Streptomyces olivochromogenes]
MNRACRRVIADPTCPFDQLREHSGAVLGEIPGLLERLAAAPDPRDPRGVRHALVVMPALTAWAVLAGATSLLAVGEWITDAPPSALERLGVQPDPLSPKRCLPTEVTVCRPLGRIDGDASDRAVGRWLADRRTGADGRLYAWRSTARPCAERPGPRAARFICSPPAATSPAWSWPNSTLARRPTRSPASSLCWRPSPIWRAWS